MAMTLQARLPRDIPSKARVYPLAPPKASVASLKATARSLGIEGDAFDRLSSKDRLGLTGGRWQIEMHRKSGAWQALHIDRYGVDTGEAFELSDRRAQGLAVRFLAQTRLVPMDSARPVRVTHLRGADGDPSGKQITERVLDAGVVFGRIVDDLPVTGPGGMAMVHLDGAGEVVGLRSIWRDLGRSAGTVKIQPVEWAIEGLRKATSAVLGDVEVLKAQFGYFELGAMDRQTVLEPTYAFVYAVRHGDIASKHVHVVHAGDKTFGRLIGRKRFPTPRQGARRAVPIDRTA